MTITYFVGYQSKAAGKLSTAAIDRRQRLPLYDLIKALNPACSKWRSYESASIMPSSSIHAEGGAVQT
jgi:hypothetical protein